MTFIDNIFSTYIVKVVLSFVPLIITVFVLIMKKTKAIKEQQEIKRRYNLLNGTIADKSVSQFIKTSHAKNNILTRLTSQMNVLGIENRFENISLVGLGLFFVGAVVGNLLMGAGPLLMIYFGVISLITIYILLLNKMEKKRKALREEFMEKLRNISSSMSVGLNFQTAIIESLNSTNTSTVMSRELGKVKDSIFIGNKYSDAFMKMYERLQIDEIKEFAQMCFVYEETGGQFTDVIHSFEESYSMKRKISQESEVFEESMKNDQKVIIGIPLLCIVGFSIFMPEAIRGFYSSFHGQIIGVVLLSMVYGGVLLQSRVMKVRGDK